MRQQVRQGSRSISAGVSPDDKKFRNCQSLYLASNSGAAKAAMFDVNSDQDWLDWYASKV